jgi:myo-inositol-1(or 4)-monophosphatase
VTRAHDVARIGEALHAASELLRTFVGPEMAVDFKSPHHPVTEADLAVDALLRARLPEAGDGWLSEETEDDASRLRCRRVWVVDPLDGTREFIRGVPEWSVSIALVEDGVAVAGGICNPVRDEFVFGSRETGITWNGTTVAPRPLARAADAIVLASRSEYARGEWAWVEARGVTVRPVGSVAYKLGLVAAGHADATWSRSPKSEWDVAAGAALLAAVGGVLVDADGNALTFNRERTRLREIWGFSAAARPLLDSCRAARR